jgi:hypothetical protein
MSEQKYKTKAESFSQGGADTPLPRLCAPMVRVNMPNIPKDIVAGSFYYVELNKKASFFLTESKEQY